MHSYNLLQSLYFWGGFETGSKLEKLVERLKKENEQLKKELAAERQTPKWVKPNKPKKKKKGPKLGHPCHPRRQPENRGQTIVVFPESCPNSHKERAFPPDSKWRSHVQIDWPEPGQPIVTEFLVGFSYCADCGKYHSAKGRMPSSVYDPRLHAQVCYWKYSLGLPLLKIHQLLKEQYGLELSTAQLSEIITRSAKKFKEFVVKRTQGFGNPVFFQSVDREKPWAYR